MTEAQSDNPSEKKKYRYTKQLIRIALDNGYTNADIAVKAGLSPKSIGQVSRWRNGESQATERQMRALVKEFGHLLKRKMVHLLSADKNDKQQFFCLEGNILLKHTFKIPTTKSSVGIYRTLLLENGENLIAVFQQRHGLQDRINIKLLSHSDNEDANWSTINIQTSDSPQLIIGVLDMFAASITEYEQYNLAKVHEIERKVLGFKSRQVLLKNGLEIDDIRSIDLSACNIQNDQTQ